jgi:membrane protein
MVERLKKNFWRLKFYLESFSYNLRNHHFLNLNASMSFYFLLTLIPFIVIIFFFLTQWLANSKLALYEIEMITNSLIPEISTKVLKEINNFSREQKGLGWLWVFILFWSTTPLAQSLRKNIQIIFHQNQPNEGFFKKKIVDVSVLILIMLLFFSYIFFSKYLANLTNFFAILIPIAEKSFLLSLSSAVLLVAALFLFFKILIPIRRIRNYYLVLGAIITCVLWISLRELFDIFMNIGQSYGLFYGSLRNIFISIIWLFFNVASFLAGIEFIAFMYELRYYKYKSLIINPNKELFDNFFKEHALRYRKEETIFNEGDNSDFFYFITEGEIETSLNDKTFLHRNNEYFGELSIINNTKRLGHAKVISDWAKIIRIRGNVLRKLLREDPTFQSVILNNLNKKIIF